MSFALKLNQRITIQAPLTGQNEFGEPLQGWANVFSFGDGSIAAGVNPLSGRELIAAQAAQSEVSHRVEVRYQPEFATPTVVATWRAVYGSRIFNIKAAINRNEGNRFVDLMCTEGLNLG